MRGFLRGYSIFYALILAVSILVAGCGSTDAVRLGDEMAESEKWDEAVMHYAEALSEEPKNIDYKIKYRRAKVQAARVHYVRGVELQEEGDLTGALLEYRGSLLLDPSVKRAESAMRKIIKKVQSEELLSEGRELLKDGDKWQAKKLFKKALVFDRENVAAKEEIEKLKAAQQVTMGGYELDLKSNAPINLKFTNEPIKKIFRYLSGLSGINFIYDSDIKDKKTSLYLKDATFGKALELLLMTNKLSKKVVSENTIVIYPRSPQKAKQYEEMLVKVFYLSNIDAKKAVNMLRTMVKATDLYVHSDINAIVIRARPDAVELARKIIEATDLADAEVMLVVDILEVDRTKALNLGIDFPDALTLTIPQATTTLGGSVMGILVEDLKSLSYPNELIASIPSGVINFDKQDLDAKLLANPRIRVKNNEKAKIHIGERVPIIMSTVSSNAAVTTENVQYQDVGIKLNVEPRITPNDEIDLQVTLEVSSLGTKTETNSGSVVYQIGTRNTETVLRLYDGETAVIGGLISDEERTTVVKLPGFGDMPIIGKLFASSDTSTVTTDILLSITPHIIRSLEVPDAETSEFLSGLQDSPSGAASMGGAYGGAADPTFQSVTDEVDDDAPPPPPLPPGRRPAPEWGDDAESPSGFRPAFP